MKLHEIIAINSEATKSVLYELCIPYIKSLKTYYENLFCGSIIVMVTSVTNSTCYVKFVPVHNFNESIYDFLEVNYVQDNDNDNDFDEDLFVEFETICANSFFLK